MDYARHNQARLRLPRGTVEGVAAWAVFAVLAVALRGIRWDEDYEFAQIIAGSVVYPAGHPLSVIARNVYNIQVYGAGALYALTHSAELVCAIRNILFLATTVVPTFLLGSLMSGRTLCGHVAVVFVLSGAHLTFDSSYPLQTWGHFFSNDHVAMGYSLAAACVVAWRRYRFGYFLVGLMPCIGASHILPLCGLALVVALVTARERQWRDLLDAAVGLAAGLCVCALIVFAVRPYHIVEVTESVYTAPSDVQTLGAAVGDAALHGEGTSSTNAHLGMLLFLLFALAASRVERYRRDFQPWRWMFVYGGFAAVLAWGTTMLHLLPGSRVPFWMAEWVPYQLNNHVLVLLVAGLPAIVAATDPLRGGRVAAGLIIMICALVYGAAGLVTGAWTLSGPHPIATHWIQGWFSPEALFFFVCGAAGTLVHAALRDDKPFRARWTIAALGALVVVAMHHRYGACCILAGVLGRVGLDRFLRRFPRQHEQLQLLAVRGRLLAVATSCVLVILVLLQWHEQVWLPRTAFERQVAACLLRRGAPKAMIVAGPGQYSAQACLNHPVMAGITLLEGSVSSPLLAASTAGLYDVIYGSRFGETVMPLPRWETVWCERRKEEWQHLAQLYGFQYVLAPNHVAIDLPSVLIGETDSLYEVPGIGPT